MGRCSPPASSPSGSPTRSTSSQSPTGTLHVAAPGSTSAGRSACCSSPSPPGSRRASGGAAARRTGLRFISVPLGFGVVGLGAARLRLPARTSTRSPSALAAARRCVAVMARLMLTFRDNVAMLRASRDEALTDALTGLGNRRALARDARRRCCPRPTTRRPLVLVLFDLDGFKHYNDTFGHPAGDALLVRLGAQPGRPTCAAAARAYRMGGDEFCVLLRARATRSPTRSSPAPPPALTEHGEGFAIGCSYGAIVLPREADGRRPRRCGIADQRMYAQKNAGRASATRQSKRRAAARAGRAQPRAAPAPRAASPSSPRRPPQRLGLDRRGGRAGPPRRRAARRRQGRDPGRDPQQARRRSTRTSGRSSAATR